MSIEVLPGKPMPLGPTCDEGGINFALYSRVATRVEVCLYDPADPQREIGRFDLPEKTDFIHYGYAKGLKPGTLYGLRVHGPYEPENGHRCNPAKLLVDPNAKAIWGEPDWKQPLCAYVPGQDQEDLLIDTRDSALGAPRSIALADTFDWGDDKKPETPWRRTVIYEAHIKGMTARHPGVPEHLRGTYAGMAHPAIIEHLRALGVTAVELMPVHEFTTDSFLADKGLTNYWGYSTLNYFSPSQRYSTRDYPGAQVDEFKGMVKALHAAGIEVILDVVYNHSCEGNHLGPTLSFRGVDNATYYWLMPEKRHYLDFTGCGNSINASNPIAARMIADSLRYWAVDMHVDGFRFDLATVLGRTGQGGFDRASAFFQIVAQDPVLSTVKLIAEPWDTGSGGYQVGNFPAPWHEWNGKYRDAVRKFWKGDENQAAEMGYRISGNSDLYRGENRRPLASINFVTAHDGFTLRDLVAYSQKHNEANGEDGHDGADDNQSWNCGAEGDTDDAEINALRERQKRNLLATLMLSQGAPMILAGDELGRTQKGNNNSYGQDNELSWIDWSLNDRDRALLDFTRKLIAFRKTQPVLQRLRFFRGESIADDKEKDITWMRPDASEMTGEDWEKPFVRSWMYSINGDAIPSLGETGAPIVGDGLLVMFNAHHEPIEFTLPAAKDGRVWCFELDTGDEKRAANGPQPKHTLMGRALAVFRLPKK
jgi:isoamylase